MNEREPEATMNERDPEATRTALTGGCLVVRMGGLSLRLHPARLRRCGALAMTLAVGAVAALALGSQAVPWPALWGWGAADDVAAAQMVLALRLPRVLLALTCGGMLGLAGAGLQSLTRNGLADPGLIGVREGAALAVVLAILALPALPLAWRPVWGLAGGLAAALAVMAVCRGTAGMRFVLVGIGVSWLLAALLAMVLVAADVSAMQVAMTWLAGSLNGASWDRVVLAGLCLGAGGAVLGLTVRGAAVAALGRPLAAGLGLRPGVLDAVRLAAIVLLVAGGVSVAGRLGFVGLVAPHLARLSLAGGEGSHLAGAALWGALLVVAADTVGRVAFAPLQIPAGIVLAAIGVPVLLWLVWRRRHQF